MKILHITDFHFKPNKQDIFKQNKIIEDLISHIKSNLISIDFICFTGDIVYSGKEPQDFNQASIALIDKLLSELNLSKEFFFICPGNHDVDRSLTSPAITSKIDSFTNNIELDTFVEKSDIDFKGSLTPLNNYNKFTIEYFKDNVNDKINFEYSTHQRVYKDKKIGFFCGNSAWRSVGNADEGNLVLPPNWIQSGLLDLKDCDVKILLHHHPITQFKLFNQHEIEDLIHNNFNISLSGHLHKNSTSVCYTDKDGILKVASAATLAENDGSTIGFTVLDLNLESFNVEAICYKYDRAGEFFYHGKPTRLQIPISSEKAKQNKFRQRLRTLYEYELENADDLFLNGNGNKDNKGFKELWTNPVLSSKSPEEVRKDATVGIVNVDDVVKSYANYLIMGDDKCGKTSLLKKIQLDCLTHYNSNEKIPIYFDAKKIDKKIDHVKSKLDKELATYFEVNRNTAKELMDKEIVVLLIDNLDLTKEEDLQWLEELIRSFKYAQILICTDQNSSSKYQDLNINGFKVTNLYFHSLKPKQLRELANKFYGASEAKLEVITRINHIFNMLAIPFNFWSVSLFMWVFKDSRKDITNDVDLVDLYIESILEREKLIKSKSGFSYDKYKQYLAHLAKYLLNFSDFNYSATKDNIYDFTKDYLLYNPRNNTDANTIWDYILNKGIIKLVADNRFTFRLNGVFEYFLAHYLKLDSKFRNEIINDNNVYLSFKNELEMFAGSNRGDEDFVQNIFDKTKLIFRNLKKEFASSNADDLLSSLAIEDIALHLDSTSTDLLKQSLSIEEVEKLEDSDGDITNISIQENCEVKLKRFMPIDENDIVSLEKSLYILGRVFKNADDITNYKLINEIFDYLIETTISWGFKLFETFKPLNSELDNEKNHIALLIKLMRQMLPIIVQSRFSDMIGASNLQSIIKQKYEDVKGFSDKNQFKKFILLYTLTDIDIVKNLEFINESVSEIKIPILRYSILMKILYYYNFRLLEFTPSTKLKVEKNLQSCFVDAGIKFNSKLYNKEKVQLAFQNFDRMRTINAKKSAI